MFPEYGPTALPPPSIPPAIYDELLSYLRKSGCPLTPTEAINNAIKLWIGQQQANLVSERGYQWKQLFLPNATRVRMNFDGQWHFACIEDDELMYQGRVMSPHQMVLQIAGNGRNAWRELWLRFPGQRDWSNADRLRIQLSKRTASAPKSPEEAMSAAAKAMSDALSTALTLVEHANHQSQNQLERRLPRYRRTEDMMEDVD